MVETDVVVLGVGTCGDDVSLRLLAAGLEVVGIEARLLGGECPYWACLPTKAMIRSANLLQEARRADGLVGTVEVNPDWSLVAGRVREEITGGWDDATAVARFTDRGGRFVRGRGRLTGPRTVAVDGVEYLARRGIVIATGSEPVVPPIPGLSDVPYWTTRDAIEVEHLPSSLIVLGGGAVGAELGQVFSRFGRRGHHRGGPEPPPAVGGARGLRGGRRRVCGRGHPLAHRRHGRGAARGGCHGDRHARQWRGGGRGGSAPRHRAEGRVGRTRTRCRRYRPSGRAMDVDQRLQAAPDIWAIGDVTGIGMFTHVALYQAGVAVAGILGDEAAVADYTGLPRVTFTDPEVGSVGLGEAQARDAGLDVMVTVKELPATFRGWLHRTGNSGVQELVVDRSSSRLVGATVVGPFRWRHSWA